MFWFLWRYDSRGHANAVKYTHGSHGLELNRIEYSVAGKGNLTLSLEKNAELQLALNKADYNPGEEIELQIKAPYASSFDESIDTEGPSSPIWTVLVPGPIVGSCSEQAR